MPHNKRKSTQHALVHFPFTHNYFSERARGCLPLHTVRCYLRRSRFSLARLLCVCLCVFFCSVVALLFCFHSCAKACVPVDSLARDALALALGVRASRRAANRSMLRTEAAYETNATFFSVHSTTLHAASRPYQYSLEPTHFARPLNGVCLLLRLLHFNSFEPFLIWILDVNFTQF